jgi:hypothetical protein
MKIFALLAVVSLITIPTVSRANTVAILIGGDTLALVDMTAAAVTRTITIPNSVSPLVDIDIRLVGGQL